MSEESKINPNSFFDHDSYDSAASAMPEFGENMKKAAQLSSDVGNSESEWQELGHLMQFMIDQMKEFYGITQTEAPNHIMQEELNKENNAKLPMGLTMTRDGQNIDLGKFAGDQARMIGTLGSDPIFADKLKEHGKQFGFDNMTPEKFQEIANQQGDSVQQSINQYVKGTDAYESAQISDTMSLNTADAKAAANQSNWGMINGRAKGGEIRSGQPYLVGEKGPEMIIPNSSGQVITNSNLKAIEHERNITMLNKNTSKRKLVIQPVIRNNNHTVRYRG